jgi:hypothetical protein
MANRPTPAFLRPPRARAVAGKTFTRFKAEAARPEQQAIFRMMIKDDHPGDRGFRWVLRSVPMRVALGLVVVSVGLAAGQRYGFTTRQEAGPVRKAEVVEIAPGVALVPGSRFAVSAAARGVEPPNAQAAPVLTPAVSSTTWSLGTAEAHEAGARAPGAGPEPARERVEAAPPPPKPESEADEEGAGGPFASWVPEPKPEPIRSEQAPADGPGHEVYLAVVKYERSADTIREAFAREVPWNGPIEFKLAPFHGGSLKVLSVTGLASPAEAAEMCARAQAHGFECVLAES